MDRRSFLSAVGGSLAALAGCVTDGDRPGAAPTTGTPTDSPTPATDRPATATSTPARDVAVTVASVVDQWGYVVPSSPDSIGVMATDRQFVVADVRVPDGAYQRSAFVVETGNGGVEPTAFEQFYRTDWDDDQWYERGRERGLLLFDVSGGPGGETPRLTWPGGDYRLSEAAVRRLTAPRPAMDATLAVPDAADSSPTKTVRVAVTNEGDVGGRYLGALNRVGPMVASTPVARVSGLVDAGETRTFEVSDDWGGYPTADGSGDDGVAVTYTLHDADGGDSLDLAIDGSA